MPTTLEVGKRLVELCKKGQFLQAIDELYGQDIVSNEAGAMPGHSPTVKGFKAIRDKSVQFTNGHDIHGSEIKGPYPNGDRFVVFMMIDATAKEGPMAGKRFKMEEACLYTVKDGKVVEEYFFYDMGM